ncbi:MAG: metallophosphoesterase, partial [Candidatus Korarchaeota archaeon]|nr:metallophosphoesterase [Candidatus Korarchaeota archaeon]
LFQKFFQFHQITKVDNTAIIILSSARPDRDDGEVGHRQNLWLEDTLKKYENYTKIVAIHHHVMPVPDTGADPITIMDAGDVLRSLTRNQANLVLCGHRHRPWKWQIEDMQVINAGSISCKKMRGFFCNSYNVIQIRNGHIKARLKIVGANYV